MAFVLDPVRPHHIQCVLENGDVLLVTKLVAVFGCPIEKSVFCLDGTKTERFRVRLIEQPIGSLDRRGRGLFTTYGHGQQSNND